MIAQSFKDGNTYVITYRSVVITYILCPEIHFYFINTSLYCNIYKNFFKYFVGKCHLLLFFIEKANYACQEENMKLAVCDDNTGYIYYLLSHIRKYISERGLSISTYVILPDDLVDRIKSREFNFDIIFMNVKMNCHDGILLAHMINRIRSECMIVFTADHFDLAMEMYNVYHSYIVLKSETEKMLPLALNQAIEAASKQYDNYLTITVHSHKIILDTNEIMYAEVYGRKLTLHLRMRQYSFNHTMKKFHDLIPHFIRIHNSYLVNPAYVCTISKSRCVLLNGKIFPVSRTFQKSAVQKYTDYHDKQQGVTIANELNPSSILP